MTERTRSGRPPLPPEARMRRRPVGMLPAHWRAVYRAAAARGVSADAVLRRLVERHLMRE